MNLSAPSALPPTADRRRKRTTEKIPDRRTVLLAGLGMTLLALAAAALGTGRYGADLSDLLALLTGKISGSDAERLHNVFLYLRLPRIAAAVLIGASLATAGTTYQAMFANPLVSPNLCGVQAGACFGAALGMVLSDNWLVVQFTTFAFGLAAVGIAVSIAAAFRRGADPMLLLILGGVIAGALFSALLALVKYTADPYDKLPAIVYWLMGSLAASDWTTLGQVALPMMIALGLLGVLGSRLNLLSLGDESALSLGINASATRLLAIFLATLLSSLTVVLGGEIGWIGLIIPHVARLIVGPDNRFLLPASALLGATFLLLVDTAARSLFRVEIPVGILTAFLGVITFVLVLGRVRKGWA